MLTGLGLAIVPPPTVCTVYSTVKIYNESAGTRCVLCTHTLPLLHVASTTLPRGSGGLVRSGIRDPIEYIRNKVTLKSRVGLEE